MLYNIRVCLYKGVKSDIMKASGVENRVKTALVLLNSKSYPLCADKTAEKLRPINLLNPFSVLNFAVSIRESHPTLHIIYSGINSPRQSRWSGR